MLVEMFRAAERRMRSKTRYNPPKQVRTVLVLEYMLPLGCLVHMTPVFETIKRSLPEAAIAVATRGLGLQLLRHSKFVDHLIETPNPIVALRAAVSGLRKQLRARGIQPDCVLTGASDQRTRIALLALLGTDAWRGGYTVRPSLYQMPLAYDPALSLIRNNLRLAKLIGCDVEVTRPQVFFSSRDAATAESLLRECNPDGRPLMVVVTQNSGGQSTGWHTDRWAQVIHYAARQLGCAVVYAGTSADAAAIDAIRQSADGVGTSIAGKTTVNELAAVLAFSDSMVTLDTGTMHVGRAVDVPMVVLAPSWQKPVEWLPLDVSNVRILRGADRTSAPEGYRLDEISSQSVIAALSELLATYPVSAQARRGRLTAGVSDIDHMPGM